MTDASRLFSEKHGSYVRFIRAVRYPRSPLLRAGTRVLDAGCGTGVVTLALRDALVSRSLALGSLHAFDLTPAMLERFRRTLTRRGLEGVETAQAEGLALEALPEAWSGHDRIVSASMLEYVARERLPDALRRLRARLRADGRFALWGYAIEATP